MEKIIVNKRFTQEQVRKSIAPLSLDLTAMFRQLMQDIIEYIGDAQRAGYTPEEAINKIDDLFGREDITDADEAKRWRE
jgi:hypothetical protein